MNAFEAAEKNGRAADLQKELETLFNRQNKAPINRALPPRRHFCALRFRFEVNRPVDIARLPSLSIFIVSHSCIVSRL